MSETSERHKAEAPRILKFMVFTVSTSRHQQIMKGEPANDASGDLAESLLKDANHSIMLRKIISDDKTMIEQAIADALASANADVVVFCGGTGIASSDVTIETVSPFLEKVLPGFGEIFRRLSFDQMGSAAVMSRAIAGVARGKVFFCIPGSPDAVRLCFERLILPEAGHIVRHARE